MPDTRIQRIIRHIPNERGWRNLVYSEGEAIEGIDLPGDTESLLNLIHISDLHICDAQSPARVELMDRYADPHHPMSAHVKLVGVYRANEIMTTQTLEAMVRTINKISTGVVTERPVDAVVITGDVTDNAQSNELSWYLTLMDGGILLPDSGNKEVWEGVASKDPKKYDPSYWNPDGTPEGCIEDYPRSLYGLPTIPGLTDAVRKQFQAEGLKHKWFATHGNHDALLQGTVVPDDFTNSFAVGNNRTVELSPDTDLEAMFGNFTQVGPTSYPKPEGATYTEITPDQNRHFNERESWAKNHTECGHDHGLDQSNVLAKSKYWARDIGDFRLISLDTVNEFGGWQGSLDREQFEWLKNQFENPVPKYFILLSHHPAPTLFNTYAPVGVAPRVDEKELIAELLLEKRVILWLAGHNHEHSIEYVGTEGKDGFWHIQTASNIDWPQQGRQVEILQIGGELAIVTSVFDHQSPIDLAQASKDLSDPVNLAGISRILSANHWQRRSGEFDLELMAGSKKDRNRLLRLGAHRK